MPALGLYTSLGFVREKRLHRFYLNGKDAFRLVLPLCGAKDAAAAATAAPGSTDLLKWLPSALPPPPGTSDDDDDEEEEEEYEYNDAGHRVPAAAARMEPAPGSPSSSAGDDSEGYAEDPAKLVRLRRRVAALRACRMITVWPADDDDRVSGR